MTEFTKILVDLHGTEGARRILGRMVDPEGIFGPVISDEFRANLETEIRECAD